MTYQKFHIGISCENFDEDVKPLIKEVRPHWNIETLKTKQLLGGTSNILFGVYCDDKFKEGLTDMILVRINGENIIDRDLEMVNMSALSKYNLSANVWGQFSNGCCYQFVHGSLLDLCSMSTPPIYSLIINEFAKLHTITLDIDRPKRPFLFHKMKEMVEHLPLSLADATRNEIYLQQFPSKERILQEIFQLEQEIHSLNCPITFCHNDLNFRNMVLSTEKDRIHMIDFEYADYNYSAFDIGNHFNEYAGLDNPDYSLYPNKSFQIVWLRQYLEAVQLAKQNANEFLNEKPTTVDDSEVEHWFRMTNKFSLTSHLLWCIWSILQDVTSQIEVDFLRYSIMRWNEYVLRKEEFNAL